MNVAAEQPRTAYTTLAEVPGKYASPDPSTLATIPKGGVNLSYMGHAEVTLALIEVDPLWTWEPLAIDPTTGGPVITPLGNRLVMWARLTVCGKSIIGVGTCEAKKNDPEKELIGDFLRNAAMRFGIGTKLWSKAVDADPAGTGKGGGYEPTYSAATVALFDRVKAAKGTPMADALKVLAQSNNMKLTLEALEHDPTWAEIVAAELDAQ